MTQPDAPKYGLVMGLHPGTLYTIDRMAESGRLEAVVIQQPRLPTTWYSLLREAARQVRNLWDDPRRRQSRLLKEILPGFRDTHALDGQTHRKLRRLARQHGFDLLLTRAINDDVDVQRYLSRCRSQQALVLGGEVLKPAVLHSFHGVWINCHGGLLPYYRGLYSEYWAVKNGDHDKIGWTIHELVERIDAGRVFRSGTIAYRPEETLLELMMRNHAAMILAYLDFAASLPNAANHGEKHSPARENYYSVPKQRPLGRLLNSKVRRL